MKAHLLTCPFYQKCLVLNFFSIKNRMSYLRTHCDNFENYRKMTFPCERNLEKLLIFCEFLPDFHSKNAFELKKDRRIGMRGLQYCSEKKGQ